MERVCVVDLVAVAGGVSGRLPDLDVLPSQRAVVALIGLSCSLCGRFVDRLEESPSQNETDLIVVGGTTDSAFGAFHHICCLVDEVLTGDVEELVLDLGRLLPERFGARRQGHDDSDSWCRRGRLKQDLQHVDCGLCHLLDVAISRGDEAAEVLRHLVNDDDRRLVTDHVQPGLLAGACAAGITGRHGRPSIVAELSGDLTPDRVSGGPVGCQSVNRVETVADDGRHPTVRR